MNNNMLYPCDPDKNVKCSKTGCFRTGGDCYMTSSPDFAKDVDMPENVDISRKSADAGLRYIESEPTWEQVVEYCRKRRLAIVDMALLAT